MQWCRQKRASVHVSTDGITGRLLSLSALVMGICTVAMHLLIRQTCCNAPPHPPNVLQCTTTSAIHDCVGKIACTIHDCAGKIACTFTCRQRTPSHPRWQQCPQTLQWGSAESAPACGVYERALGIVNDRSAEPCVRTRCLGTNRGEGLGEGRWGGRGGQWCR